MEYLCYLTNASLTLRLVEYLLGLPQLTVSNAIDALLKKTGEFTARRVEALESTPFSTKRVYTR
ncbi:hypothetical protein NIES4073_45750 [Kalymmatonema gypsitolerans NIES-4073]|nr:hypothetical protein NIES4073_45750 [Scytonema sp. NIES-4073]